MRENWREIGFYYQRDDVSLIWQIIGSRAGLKRLCGTLKTYVRDFDAHVRTGDRGLTGPYKYLKVVNWHMASILRDGIYGPLESIQGLATTIEEKLNLHNPGECFIIDEEYSDVNAYKLELVVREDEWDPSNVD
jgi:hypothetical protein